MALSDTAAPVAKKAKTTPATGTPLYSDLDATKLTIDATAQGQETAWF